MFLWVKKLVLKSLVKDIVKELPHLKDLADLYIEQHAPELIIGIKNFVIEKIKEKLHNN